jgi:diguanylate cyclase (GGDEF)-like protein
MIDNATLFVGIAFSAGSLMLALMIGWLNARGETYLAYGSIGIALVMLGVAILAMRGTLYDLYVTLLPYGLILTGLAFILAASRLFREWDADLRPALVVGSIGLVSMGAAFLTGWFGTGTILLNIWAGLIMLMCAGEYWKARSDAQVAMIANTLLYAVTAVSFLACAGVLLAEERWTLTAPADNWAEDFNSIMTLVGLTGIGAITLTLHHARAARHHRNEANTDSLTGVLNRRALFDRFGENHPAPGLAVVMFDLDRFKQINDFMGHAHGDVVLQRFADVLKAGLHGNEIVARLGGEEFCVILPGMDANAARDVAECIRARFAELRIPIGQDDTIATVSAGIAIGGADETFSSVLSRADAALYKAKDAGRNQVQLAALRRVA